MEQQTEKQKGWPRRHPILTLLFIMIAFMIVVAVNNSGNPVPQKGKLNVRVKSSDLGLTIHNDDQTKWTGCTVTLNDDYRIYADMNPGENLFLYNQFTKKDGTRFDYLTTKPNGSFIECESPYAEW